MVSGISEFGAGAFEALTHREIMLNPLNAALASPGAGARALQTSRLTAAQKALSARAQAAGDAGEIVGLLGPARIFECLLGLRPEDVLRSQRI